MLKQYQLKVVCKCKSLILPLTGMQRRCMLLAFDDFKKKKKRTFYLHLMRLSCRIQTGLKNKKNSLVLFVLYSVWED